MRGLIAILTHVRYDTAIMHPLTDLVCGAPVPSGSIGDVVTHLSESLDRLLEKAIGIQKGADVVESALYGPYLGRSILEVSFTALYARFDPFRVLAIRQSQLTPEFDLRTRNPLAFNWTSDVQGDEKPKEWSQRFAIRDLQRALLCGHYHDVFWREAFTGLLDAVPPHRGSNWMTRLRQVDPESFTTRMRQEADRLYSEQSKAVHHEFVIPLVSQYDKTTVSELLHRTFELIGRLALTTSHSPAARPVDANHALQQFESAQAELVSL